MSNRMVGDGVESVQIPNDLSQTHMSVFSHQSSVVDIGCRNDQPHGDILKAHVLQEIDNAVFWTFAESKNLLQLLLEFDIQSFRGVVALFFYEKEVLDGEEISGEISGEIPEEISEEIPEKKKNTCIHTLWEYSVQSGVQRLEEVMTTLKRSAKRIRMTFI